MRTGEWKKLGYEDELSSLELETLKFKAVDPVKIPGLRSASFAEAEKVALELASYPDPEFITDQDEVEELKSFYYAHTIEGDSMSGMCGGGQ